MYCVYVFQLPGECSVVMADGYGKYQALDTYWSRILNANYLDDMREINHYMEQFQSRIDSLGRRWHLCEFESLRATVCKIVHAYVPAQVPMLFLGAHVRRSLRALASTRLLPRDLLREVSAHAQIDEITELARIFNVYTFLKSIVGLYARAITDGVRGPRFRVDEIQLLDQHVELYTPYVMWLHDTPLNFRFNKYEGCITHFYMCLRDTRSHLIGFTWDATDFLREYTLEFEAEAEIKFVHKSLHKRRAPAV